jgi:LmbE family N-acetylglucosaminyl deacetylase
MNILAFFAHPDDETILSGGVLALLARYGAAVYYLCATRGEGGEVGEPPLCSQEELGGVRTQELMKAVHALGGRSLTFLGYMDPPVGPGEKLFAYTQNITALAGQVDASIRQFQVDVVITHGSNGEYGHPAHLVSHQAARIAVESFALTDPDRTNPLLYTVSAAYPGHPRPRRANQDDSAHLLIDVSEVLDIKAEAAMCHRTQHALFVRRASEAAGHKLSVPETLLTEESLHRALPPVESGVDDELARLLKPWNKLVS